MVKISNVQSVYELYKPQKAMTPQKTSEISTPKDVVALSNAAKDFQAIRNAVAKTPDIRQDKVDVLKEKINNGTYAVSDDALANKMLKGLFE